MMTTTNSTDLSGIWNGTLDGTNWGQLLCKLDEESSGISGIAQIIDVGLGTYNLDVRGSRDGSSVSLTLVQGKHNVREYAGTIDVACSHTAVNLLEGEWTSSIGTYGTFRAERETRPLPPPEALAAQAAEANAALIIMAFSDHQSGFIPVVDISAAISRACASVDIRAERADQIEHSGLITSVILERIKSRRFLISDLTHQRQNVYYEIGFAHGLGKEVVLTAQKPTEIHFDIAGYNVIQYESLTELEERVVSRLKAKLTVAEQSRT